jgi:hypothetical protein
MTRVPSRSPLDPVPAFRRKIVTVVLGALLLGTGARAEVIDRIMAVVSGRPITLSEVNAALQFHLVEPPPGTRDPLAFALDRLLERVLMLAEVDRFQPPEPAPVEITIRVDALERRAGSAAAFDKSLSVTGTSRDQLRRYIRDELRTTTYLNQRFGANTPEAERSAAIAAWLADLRRRAEVTVQYAGRS